MHSSTTALDVMRNPIQHYLPQQALMNYAAAAATTTAAARSENPIIARMPISNQIIPLSETPKVAIDFCDRDILLGRGGHANHHKGNQALLERVKFFQPTYKSFGSEEDGKKQKNNLTRQLVEWVATQGGRFLKRTGKNMQWQEVSYNEARMKVSHLFRNDHTPEGRERKRKKYSNQKNRPNNRPFKTKQEETAC